MIRFENVNKSFYIKEKTVEALKNVNLKIKQGEIFGVIGFSGAGKSTLIRCINLLERPDTGKVYFKDTELTALSEKALRSYRRKIGMIFQQFNLLEQKTVLANVCYPLEISGVKKSDAVKRARRLLEIVGLEEKEKTYPSCLSGGQKQRVAIARALATNPEVLLCDEATSALDPITTSSILSLLKDINQKLGVTIVVITHEMKVVEQICDRVAIMSEGVIEETGDVKEIFINPRSSTARKLIMPGKTVGEISSKERVLRLVFDGQSSNEPVISGITINCNVLVNILGANTEDIGGKAYGQMLIELPDEEETLTKVKHYLDNRNIYYEECRKGGDAI